MEFSLAVVSCGDETQCVGNVHNVSSTYVAEFDFLTENPDNGVKHCVLTVISRCKFCNLMLSSTFYIHTVH